jgi:ferric-dicitrate binding protein FerR (iron transport regulator)
MPETFHIADLIVKKIRGSLTLDEQHELDHWISESPENQEIYNRARDPEKQMEKLEVYALFDKDQSWADLEEHLFETRTITFTSRKIFRYAAAILLPLIVGGGFTWWYLKSPSPVSMAVIDQEIKPGSQRAVLILSDGGMVELGQETSLENLSDGGVSIRDVANSISYSTVDEGLASAEVLFNELRTPRGGGYQLQLADGSRVWLNAGSSLRYPVGFQDSVRQVFLEGEAYFEVNHNGKPFIVSTGSLNTRVLGTSFNISAYADDLEYKTTLLEGKVRVELLDRDAHISASTILESNQQATIEKSSAALSKTEVDASGYVSWMQGKLEFHNEHLDQVMMKLARWYDFDYEFENSSARDYHFSARLDRSESISSILEMLEMTTDVKFEYLDSRIVIK